MPETRSAESVLSVIPASVRPRFLAWVVTQLALVTADPPDPDLPARLAEDALASLPEAMRARFAQIAEREAQLTAAAATREAAAKLPPSPEQLLAEAEEALAKEQRTEADAAAWEAARAKYGKGRVGKIPTVDGAIIMRVPTIAEKDAAGIRLEGVPEGQVGTRVAVAREASLDLVIHPSRDVARALCDRWPGVWMKLYELRDALCSGEEDALVGKA